MDDNMWCDLCDDKPKGALVKMGGLKYEVCDECERMVIQDKD